jgi:peptidoglycan/LPS O-acetylase OafA/YrhL
MIAHLRGKLTNVRPPGASRFDGVDVLRGLSILAVVLLHINLRMQAASISSKAMVPSWLFHLLFWNGNNGVTVFFAVSGFLITNTSLRRFGSLDLMQPMAFYRIRFARIAPLLLLLLAVLSVLHLVYAPGFHIPPQKATLPRALLAALTFHLNWLEAVRGFLPPNWDVLWSLSVEEAFYFFFPVACLLILRFRRGMTFFVAFLLIFAVMGPFARTVWTTNEIWREKSYLGGMDGIALGCLCALLTARSLRRDPQIGKARQFQLIGLRIAGAAMILLIAVWPHWSWMKSLGRSGLDGTLLALGTCMTIFATVLRRTVGGWITGPIRWFGRHSYEVYLTHEFVVVWGTLLYVKVHRGALPLWFVGILLLTAPLGAIVARYFSDPLNRRLRGARPSGPDKVANSAF